MTARLWSGGDQAADRRSRSARRAGRGARSAPSRGCRILLPRRGACRSSMGSAPRSPRLRAENGLPHEATIVGALPVIAGALVRRAKGEQPVAPDPTRSHAADTLSMMRGAHARRARSRGARCLFRHRLRSRHERVDVRRARRGLDAGRSVRGGDGGLLRADGAAAWRRAGAGAGNAGRHRHARAHPAVGRRARWHAANG